MTFRWEPGEPMLGRTRCLFWICSTKAGSLFSSSTGGGVADLSSPLIAEFGGVLISLCTLSSTEFWIKSVIFSERRENSLRSMDTIVTVFIAVAWSVTLLLLLWALPDGPGVLSLIPCWRPFDWDRVCKHFSTTGLQETLHTGHKSLFLKCTSYETRDGIWFRKVRKMI